MTKTKGSLRSQRSIMEIHSFNRTVLMDERIIKNKGEYRGIKMIVKSLIRFIPKMTTHPRAECLGNSFVVGRQ